METKQEADLGVLRKIESVEDQKSLADELGYSVGKVNYIVKALIEKGYIKAERFACSDNKRGYKYLLTRKGIAEKLRLTKLFVEIKRREYEELMSELERLG
ncbi:MarR family EPS-associated transcriptional regulator [Sulfurimonas sp. HSL-3221]|uniref:MarR family EPS-associated transcriptional regulator n=1 Tax=Sulfurimonadaceae TaxID=2771471 RepID=UPI001E5517E8|nr:MarR family EPS-associated transcriptional regulator [Sulfurimonas sp. HSL-3221]UFS62412.1 MarR family EPS-associated transcriptional regulator [Sulfurimonas sp. HSL-3221]